MFDEHWVGVGLTKRGVRVCARVCVRVCVCVVYQLLHLSIVPMMHLIINNFFRSGALYCARCFWHEPSCLWCYLKTEP